MYNFLMRFEWNAEKNKFLKHERGISFEEVVLCLSYGNLWKIIDHPNPDKYPNQVIYYVLVGQYVCLVPCILEKDYIFLKTIIPSRKATKEYQQEMENRS